MVVARAHVLRSGKRRDSHSSSGAQSDEKKINLRFFPERQYDNMLCEQQCLRRIVRALFCLIHRQTLLHPLRAEEERKEHVSSVVCNVVTLSSIIFITWINELLSRSPRTRHKYTN